MNKKILLLTATVTPPQDAAQLQRVDPALWGAALVLGAVLFRGLLMIVARRD